MSKPGFSEKNIITYFDPPYKIPREGEPVLDFTSLLWLDERVTGEYVLRMPLGLGFE